ncbi:MAG: hypothetical protein LHW45_10710 [Candidatus Cloacimonetes bacterium]|nr:hypothetical protein [Candidatus Cloacimonadota bacterium]MDY0368079.1 hypothetical protein [Candidatus Syntrophosphaera sp.]
MNIEQRRQNIESMLKTLVEQTAPPPTVQTKVKVRSLARQNLAESAERKSRRAK